MALDKKPSLEDLESQVRALTYGRHKKELDLIASILDAYIDGFKLIDPFSSTKDNEVETAWLLLITRSFHSMRCAMSLMQTGYYGQAISLIRTVLENWFICHDCANNPKAVQAILYNKYAIPNRNAGLTFSKMAQRTGKLRIYKQEYHHVSKVTHPTALSLGMLRDPETNGIRAAPSYDKILFLDCCELMLRNALGMIDFLERFLSILSRDKVTSWGKTATHPIKKAVEWLTALQGKYSEKNA